jgi:hypothetical protein
MFCFAQDDTTIVDNYFCIKTSPLAFIFRQQRIRQIPAGGNKGRTSYEKSYLFSELALIYENKRRSFYVGISISGFFPASLY